jgi:hypothetical protein
MKVPPCTVRCPGYAGASVVRFPGVTTSPVNRAARLAPLPEGRQWLEVVFSTPQSARYDGIPLPLTLETFGC